MFTASRIIFSGDAQESIISNNELDEINKNRWYKIIE